MSKPRSSRRTSARIAAFHVDDEIEISSSLQQREALGDRVSGAGPPALSLERNADLAEVPGSFTDAESTLPTFDASAFDFAIIDHTILSSRDSWVLQLIGRVFRYKEEELEDDLQFKSKHPSNVFVIHSIVTHSSDRKEFIHANVRYSERVYTLFFIR